MWIERITARSFGALRDQSLELGPGMNVVYGPNEAGKTTWHAAIRMALTGVRRGRGSSTREASALEDQHRPWDEPDRWAVEARIRLADRRIDLVQDLLGKVACRATDVDLGVDVSAEITRPDGTPDASIWLGLDRDAFATTLSVGQGDMLAVADSAGALQEHMQRAAAAHGTDATAAGALERLREYRRRAVGADTAVAKGPLRTAMREAAVRDDELAEARRRHAAYLEHGAEAEAAAHALADAERRLALIRLGQAQSLATATRRRADRAAELGERYRTPPGQLAARDALSDAVAGALAGWAARPTATRSTGRPSAAIEAELAAIPAAPTGDVSPAPAVAAALQELDLAEEAERAIHPAPAATEPTPPARRAAPVGLVGAVGLLAAAAVVFVAGATLAALAFGAGALWLAAWWYLAVRPAGRKPGPESSIALDRDQAARARTAAARDALGTALRERGIEPGADPRRAYDGYLAACRDRAASATAAAGADALRRELDSTRAAEQLAADAARAVADAEAALRAVLAAVDPGTDPEAPIGDVATGLEAWQATRADESAEAERSIREYEELTGLLDGRTVADLAAEAARVEERAAGLVAAAGTGAAPLEGDEQAAVDEVERRRAAAASLAGAMDVREADLVDVAAAEEIAIAAHGRIEAVSELASVIDETMALLEAAQRQVHRDLAPVLATAIREWLPTLSGGAYEEAGVNPADLSIEVKEAATGAWRQARLLSEGTREQIYLLLRLAMAQHLVTTPESAPMLLDEVTAQADADRKRAILDMLQALAVERQLVLFTHDDAVLGWAEDHLRGDNHRVIRLPASAGSSAAPSATPAPVSEPIGSEV
jgi:recombinational DNA repair ATPase RecF